MRNGWQVGNFWYFHALDSPTASLKVSRCSPIISSTEQLVNQYGGRSVSAGSEHAHFLYRLTDLHPSNIFVDSDWNIKYVIDLEWACSLQ
jgi:hypothetical protein